METETKIENVWRKVSALDEMHFRVCCEAIGAIFNSSKTFCRVWYWKMVETSILLTFYHSSHAITPTVVVGFFLHSSDFTIVTCLQFVCDGRRWCVSPSTTTTNCECKAREKSLTIIQLKKHLLLLNSHMAAQPSQSPWTHAENDKWHASSMEIVVVMRTSINSLFYSFSNDIKHCGG